MKSVTLPRPEDKKIVRNALPSSNIFTAAVARLYLAFDYENAWKYSGLWGAMAFCKDRNKRNSYFLRLIDMETNRGVIWEQELYIGFEYARDSPFLHFFQTDDCLAGILFVHQGEADAFYDKVINRESIKLKDHRGAQKSDVGRVRFTPGKGFSVDNNDPEVLEILRELEKLEDFSAADIDQNQDFIQDFIRQYRSASKKSSNKRAPPPPPPPSRKRSTNSLTPPPIPPMMNRPSPIAHVSPPPPPVPNRGIRQSPSIPSISIRNIGATSSSPPPPPPPPPPPRGSPIPNGTPAPLPPPAPPMMSTNSPSQLPTNVVADDSRSNLMAAIRSTGGFGSLKKTGSLKPGAMRHSDNAAPSRSFSQNNAPSKNDMTSSLAAALQQRKTALQSDDSDDSDDEDWK